MEQQLWNLFCETGDPMCYLYYRAEASRAGAATEAAREANGKTEPQTEGLPPASL